METAGNAEEISELRPRRLLRTRLTFLRVCLD